MDKRFYYEKHAKSRKMGKISLSDGMKRNQLLSVSDSVIKDHKTFYVAIRLSTSRLKKKFFFYLSVYYPGQPNQTGRFDLVGIMCT